MATLDLWCGTWALVTGASSGIGCAIAEDWRRVAQISCSRHAGNTGSSNCEENCAQFMASRSRCWPAILASHARPKMEMLLYSRPGVMEVQPALPPSLVTGSINGMMARTSAKIDTLTEARTVELTITSVKQQDIRLIARYGIESISAPAGVLAPPLQAARPRSIFIFRGTGR